MDNAAAAESLKRLADDQNAAGQNVRAALDAVAARLDSVETKLTAVQQEAEKAAAAELMPVDRPLRAVVVADGLRAAVERGSPFGAEYAAAAMMDFEPADLDTLKPFSDTGVASENELFRELSALMPELVRVFQAPAPEGGYLDRLQAEARQLVRIRPVRPASGRDPASVISRIDGDVARFDLAAALADVDKLPGPARDLAAPWQKKAQARVQAIAAARQLATAALAGLGGAPDTPPR